MLANHKVSLAFLYQSGYDLSTALSEREQVIEAAQIGIETAS